MSNRAVRLAACLLFTAGGAGAFFVVTPAPAYAGVPATVRVATSLSMRAGPARSYRLLGTLGNGAKVTVACRTNGEYVVGNTATGQWDQLVSGQYISHAYVNTGTSIPTCTTTPAASAGGVQATVRVSTSLALRAGPARSHKLLGTLGNGTKVTVACRTNGEYVVGNTATSQWDQLVSGQYISHAYVNTGTSIPTCTTTAPAGPEPNGSMTTSQFIAASVAPAQQSQREYGVPTSVTIAQAILESGWGRSALATNDKNFFGIKCFDRGPIAIGCRTYRTTECADGACYPTSASFRVYASALASFRDHGRLLTVGPRYRAAFSYSNDPNRFAVEIHRAGYATSPTYATNLQRVMSTYQLYRYDLH